MLQLVFNYVQAEFVFTQISLYHWLLRAEMSLCFRVSFVVSAKFACFAPLKSIDTFKKIFALQLSSLMVTLGSSPDQDQLFCELFQLQSGFISNFLREFIEFL